MLYVKWEKKNNNCKNGTREHSYSKRISSTKIASILTLRINLFDFIRIQEFLWSKKPIKCFKM
jgi:hypothetical protein